MEELTLCSAMAAHGKMVYRLALLRLQSPSDAEDVYQEVFLRLFTADPGLEGEQLKAWLITVTLRRCTDVHRALTRRRELPLDAVSEAAAPSSRDHSALWAAVAALPPQQRTAVYLYYAEGYKTREIAALLHAREATVRSRLDRAREKLKTMLEGEIEDE